MWCWGWETKYEVKRWDLKSQWDSDMRVEVLLDFLECTGEYIYNVKFLNEKLTTDKFYCLSKGPETHMKSNIKNYHIWLIMPVQLLYDLGSISELPGWCRTKVMQPRYFDIPTCRCPWQLFYWTVKLLQYCTVPNLGLQWVQDISRKQKSLEIAKNHRKWLDMVRIGHVTLVACGTITWSSANGA